MMKTALMEKKELQSMCQMQFPEEQAEDRRKPENHATNVVWHELYLDKKTRAALKRQHPCTCWSGTTCATA